jgi:hypothetical protein
MTIKETALSRDGYIVDQNNTDNITYGKYTSNRNGCGWIACYNLCKYLGKEFNAANIINFLEKYLWRKGLWGTSLTGVYKFMKSIGLQVKARIGKKSIIKSASKFGIVFYLHDGGCHYVFFYKYDSSNYRFLNVLGKEFDVRDLSKMLNHHVKYNACIAFII